MGLTWDQLHSVPIDINLLMELVSNITYTYNLACQQAPALGEIYQSGGIREFIEEGINLIVAT